MELEIIPKGEFKLQVPVEDILEDINRLPLIRRFAVVKKILNDVQLLSRDELTPGQTRMVLDFLERVYELYSGSFNAPKSPKKGFLQTLRKLFKQIKHEKNI